MEQALTSREAVTDLFFRTEADYFQLNRAEYFVPACSAAAPCLEHPMDSLAMAFAHEVAECEKNVGTRHDASDDGNSSRIATT